MKKINREAGRRGGREKREERREGSISCLSLPASPPPCEISRIALTTDAKPRAPARRRLAVASFALACAAALTPSRSARAEPPQAPPASATAPASAPAPAPAPAPASASAPAPAPAPASASAPAQRLDPALLLPAPRLPDDGPRRKLMLITGGLAVATVALGGIFGGMAVGAWNDVKVIAQKGCQDPENYKGCHPSVADKEYEASSFATVSTFCFLAGSLAIAGTTILWITGPPRPPARSARIQLAPVIGPQGTGGALLRGTF